MGRGEGVQVHRLARLEPLRQLGDPVRQDGVVAVRVGGLDSPRCVAHAPVPSIRRAEQRADPLQRAEVTDPRRALGDGEDGGDLGERELIQVAHHQDLAVLLGQLAQRPPDLLAFLLADQVPARAGPAGRQHVRQPQRPRPRPRGSRPRPLPARLPPQRAEVVAMGLRQPLRGEPVQPGIERQRAARGRSPGASGRRPPASPGPRPTGRAAPRAARRAAAAIIRRRRGRWRSSSQPEGPLVATGHARAAGPRSRDRRPTSSRRPVSSCKPAIPPAMLQGPAVFHEKSRAAGRPHAGPSRNLATRW